MKHEVHSAHRQWERQGGKSALGRAAKPPLLRESGKFQGIDPDHEMLSLKQEHQRAARLFRWTEATKFVNRGRAIRPEDLREGERINILYHKEGSTMLAQAVTACAQPRQSARRTVPHNNPR